MSNEPSEIRMSHDIARHLRHLPPEEAAEQVATHLRKFWEPRMRSALIARVREDDDRVDPLVVSAVHDYLAGDVDRAEVAEPSGG
ncbi:MAG: formate dehydrogenase subunit delta [Ornithinimicrobium sp.]